MKVSELINILEQCKDKSVDVHVLYNGAARMPVSTAWLTEDERLILTGSGERVHDGSDAPDVVLGVERNNDQ